jgi:hypothetical protein
LWHTCVTLPSKLKTLQRSGVGIRRALLFYLANIAREQRSRPHWCGAIEAHRIRCLSQQQLAALLGMAWTIQLGFAKARVLHKSPPCIPGLVFYLSKIHRTLKGSQASIAETCCSSRLTRGHSLSVPWHRLCCHGLITLSPGVWDLRTATVQYEQYLLLGPL